VATVVLARGADAVAIHIWHRGTPWINHAKDLAIRQWAKLAV